MCGGNWNPSTVKQETVFRSGCFRYLHLPKKRHFWGNLPGSSVGLICLDTHADWPAVKRCFFLFSSLQVLLTETPGPSSLEGKGGYSCLPTQGRCFWKTSVHFILTTLHLLCPLRDTFGTRRKIYQKSPQEFWRYSGDTVNHPNFIKHQLSFRLLMEQSECNLGIIAAGLCLSEFSCSYLWSSFKELRYRPLQWDWNSLGFQVNCGKIANICAIHTDVKKQVIMTNILRTNLKIKRILPGLSTTCFVPAFTFSSLSPSTLINSKKYSVDTAIDTMLQ